MCIAVSTGESEDRHGCTSIICRGSPRDRHKPYEKLSCDPRVLVRLKKNAWADTTTMIEIAKEFTQQDRVKHGGM